MKLNKNKQQLTDLESRLARALADYQNLEKRHQVQRADTIKFANLTLLDKLLPLLDDLYRAYDHLQDAGIKMVIDSFNQLLKSEEVVEIVAMNQNFDPLTMDCIEVVSGPKDQVVAVLTRGYLYGDKVLRPARVNVGNGTK